jgi:hypothetical protein
MQCANKIYDHAVLTKMIELSRKIDKENTLN